jgi:hypothetical protein
MKRHLVLRPTPDRTIWASQGTNRVKDDSTSTIFRQTSRVSHIALSLATAILKLPSFSALDTNTSSMQLYVVTNHKKRLNLQNNNISGGVILWKISIVAIIGVTFIPIVLHAHR